MNMNVSIRPITEADTPKIVKWRNAPSVVEHFIYRTPLTEEAHLNWFHNRVQTGDVAQFMITDTETGEEVCAISTATTASANTAFSSARTPAAARASAHAQRSWRSNTPLKSSA